MKCSLPKKYFKIQSYDTIKNDRSTGARGGVVFLVKHGLVINKEYHSTDFNIISDNEALVIDIDPSKQRKPHFVKMEIRTLDCLKPLTTFPTMSFLSAKLSALPRKNISGPVLKNI